MNSSESPKVASTKLRTNHGEFEFYCFAWGEHEEDNLLCLKKDWGAKDIPICRIQSACYTAEIFRSLDCDCHEQLEASLVRIQKEGGVLVYVLCDGRGAGLYKKTLGLELGRTKGLDTSDAYRELGVPQDPREYSRPAYALKKLGLTKLRLLTNNPRKVQGLQQHGLDVVREPLEIAATVESAPYLRTKAKKMGHLITQFDPSR